MKLTTIIIGLLAMTSCQNATDSYLIKGKLAGAPENEWIYLMDDNQRIYFDSVQLHQGTFEFRGKLDVPELRSIVFFKNPARRITGWANIMTIPVYLENSVVHVSVPFSEMPSKLSREMPQSLHIKGSASHDLYQAYRQEVDPLNIQYQQTFNAYRKAYYQNKGTEEDIFRHIKELNIIRDRVYQCGVDFIQKHGDSPIALYVASKLPAERYARSEAEKIAGLLSGQIKSSETGQQAVQTLTQKPLYLNDLLPNPEIIDINLQQKELSEFIEKGHYTLIELWASTCGPCRADIPHLKETYKHFHHKGFDIVSISVDNDTAKWQKALAEEDMPWRQVCGNSKIQKVFGINSIPSGFLVDPNGKVINMTARGGWLNLQLSELLEK